MVFIIAILFIILILLGCIISSHQANEVEETIRAYQEPDTKKEEYLRTLECYRMFIEQLDIWANQGVITKEEWEKERALVNEKLDEIERTL